MKAIEIPVGTTVSFKIYPNKIGVKPTEKTGRVISVSRKGDDVVVVETDSDFKVQAINVDDITIVRSYGANKPL